MTPGCQLAVSEGTPCVRKPILATLAGQGRIRAVGVEKCNFLFCASHMRGTRVRTQVRHLS